MQAKKVEVINPYCNDHVEAMNNFCLRQGIDNVAKSLLEIQRGQKEEVYYKNMVLNPVIHSYLAFFDHNEIVDYCAIHAEKDMKRCFLTFPVLTNPPKKREIVCLAAKYACSNLEMEEVFVKMDGSDKGISSSLRKLGFESLGFEEEEAIYMLSKEEKERERVFS